MSAIAAATKRVIGAAIDLATNQISVTMIFSHKRKREYPTLIYISSLYVETSFV